ncbi:hypothetical protein AMECASPLE_031800 [Ameca splendens]|uniref:Uncharacterized protein n=1 Tax=Ameca splendens TaxID=208324 RepID=A0ABV0XJG4_9TELE
MAAQVNQHKMLSSSTNWDKHSSDGHENSSVLAPKPGTEIQKNINNPERTETPAPAPIYSKDPTPNHSTDPNQKTCSFSRPPTPDGNQQTGVWKDPMPASVHLNVVLMRVVVECI